MIPDDNDQPSLPALDIEKLTEGVAPGAWVVIAATRDRRVAVGQSMVDAIAKARATGEPAPIVFRVSMRHATLVHSCLRPRSTSRCSPWTGQTPSRRGSSSTGPLSR